MNPNDVVDSAQALRDRNSNTLQAMMRSNARDAPTNRTYNGYEGRYIKFVMNDPNREHFNLREGCYVSEEALKAFFLKEGEKDYRPQNINRIAHGLDILVKAENALDLLGEGNKGGQSIRYGPLKETIQTCYDSVLLNHNKKIEEEDADPHKDLPTDIISEESQSKVLMKLLSKHSPSWADTASSWAMQSMVLMRFSSTRKVTLAKLVVLHQFPPHGIETPHDTKTWESVKNSKVDGRILGMIIPKREQLKKNKSVDLLDTEVVGGYRHKRHERCYHGILAFRIFELLNTDKDVSFMAKNAVPVGKMHWSMVNIFDFKYDGANKAFKKAVEDADVERWLKVTHMRYVHLILVHIFFTNLKKNSDARGLQHIQLISCMIDALFYFL